MEISGTINQILPIQKGEAKNRPWTKQEVIIETNDQYPKKICISFWNDKINGGLKNFVPNFVGSPFSTL